MKENIFDVLIYIFENYLDDDGEDDFVPDSDNIKDKLMEAGFKQNEINNAFHWLDDLSENTLIEPASHSTFRIFNLQEELKINPECRDFLFAIENDGILTPYVREIVIDKIMMTETNQSTSLEELKWTILMVLLSHSDDDIAYSHMEDIVYDLIPENTLLH